MGGYYSSPFLESIVQILPSLSQTRVSTCEERNMKCGVRFLNSAVYSSLE